MHIGMWSTEEPGEVLGRKSSPILFTLEDRYNLSGELSVRRLLNAALHGKVVHDVAFVPTSLPPFPTSPNLHRHTTQCNECIVTVSTRRLKITCNAQSRFGSVVLVQSSSSGGVTGVCHPPTHSITPSMHAASAAAVDSSIFPRVVCVSQCEEPPDQATKSVYFMFDYKYPTIN